MKINIEKSEKYKKVYFESLLRHGVMRVFVLFRVFVYMYVRAILSWCPQTGMSTLFSTFFL